MLDWIYSNKEWLFEGIGVLAISTILNKFVFTKKKQPLDMKYTKQEQKSGNNSTIYNLLRI